MRRPRLNNGRPLIGTVRIPHARMRVLIDFVRSRRSEEFKKSVRIPEWESREGRHLVIFTQMPCVYYDVPRVIAAPRGTIF